MILLFQTVPTQSRVAYCRYIDQTFFQIPVHVYYYCIIFHGLVGAFWYHVIYNLFLSKDSMHEYNV